jgi:hypothetical protein
LLSGSRHFNGIRRGVPRMSPALLTKRVQRLMKAGVVDRYDHGSRVTYQLTPAGAGAMCDIHRNVKREALPPGRTTLRFRFREPVPHGARDWWLIMAIDGTDICDFDSGYPVAATVDADLRWLVGVWRGDVSWREAIRSGGIEMLGPAQARRAVPRWLGQSTFAGVARPAR